MSEVAVTLVTDSDEIDLLLGLEQSVFEAQGFASLEPYAKYLKQSTFFGASTDDREWIGMVRMISGFPLLPPVFAHGMTVDVRPERWLSLCADGLLEEWATVVSLPGKGPLSLFFMFIRAAFRDAIERGVTHWGLIREPEVVAQMSRLYGLTFHRVGPVQHYMEEDYWTAPYVLELQEQVDNLRKFNPEYLEWVLQSDLNDFRLRPPRIRHS